MWKTVAIGVTVVALITTNTWADQDSQLSPPTTRYAECRTPLPDGYWDDGTFSEFRTSEKWAWNERICLGQEADMRYAPSGTGVAETCRPVELEKDGPSALPYRQLRGPFIEFLIRDMSWKQEERPRRLVIACAVINGDINLSWDDVPPAVFVSQSVIDGEINLQGTRLERTLAILGTTVTGPISAPSLTSKDGLYLRENSRFSDVILRGARVERDIVLSESTISGNLDAERVSVGGSLALRRGRFEIVNLRGAKIHGTAALDQSRIIGNFSADSLQVGQSLHFGRGGEFSEIDLSGAQVGSHVNFNETTVTGMIDADTLQVGRNLQMSYGSRFGDIVLRGARVEGQVALGGAVVSGILDAQALVVGGTMLLNEGGAYTSIDLTNARVGGNLQMEGSSVTTQLNGTGIDVDGDIFLHDGGQFGYIKLFGADIAGDVILSGSTFSHEVDLSGATIAGELHLASGRFDGNPVWTDQAALVLRNATANALQATASSWSLVERSHLVKTDLQGFTYHHLQGKDVLGGQSMINEPAEWLIQWLESQPDHDTNHVPQPYTELANALADAGETGKSEAIRYAGFEHERKRSDNLVHRWWLAIRGTLAGHGVYPMCALWWFLSLVGLGAICAQRSKDVVVRGFMGIWYSLENALPLLELSGRFRNVDHGRSWMQHVFHLQKLLGLVVATVWLAALTDLGG